ncbi:MAG: heavy metal-responsive transcriptional regulator [Cellulomonas sp.]|uniref:heavy metal-responsive transcriptional regulator n=1 Tax=Cellulomonas sp. TaxID=40001 RepID=UPI0017D228E7|nr:heavy metal-responsive transcriptional regulator [Cellulomonas sp.]NMM30993.1 heavy metal-responsive transcriptional regulator [Cellulomonas sp.]
MLIGELAETVGLDSQTIRFYERHGLLPEPRRAANGYRTYDTSSVNRVLFIRSAQTAGLTLAEIGSVVDLRDHGDAPCTHVTALLGSKLDAVRTRQAELVALEAELERLIARSRHLDPADCTGSDVCHILTAPHRRSTRPVATAVVDFSSTPPT